MEIKSKQGELRTKNPANPLKKQEDKPKKLVYYVSLHATLAVFDRWGCLNDIGEPVLGMKERVLSWLREGIIVKIFTARACNPETISSIREWLEINGFPSDLEITNILGEDCDMIFSDKSREVILNTGIIVDRVGQFKGE